MDNIIAAAATGSTTTGSMTKKPENEDLQPGTQEDKIEDADKAGAGTEKPEDTYADTIAKQNETIKTLLEQIESLNGQIVNYVRSAGAPVDQNTVDDGDGLDVSVKDDDYVYLKELGAEIGKR